MTRRIIIAAVIVAMVIVGIFLFGADIPVAVQTYSSSRMGISFNYPSDYIVREKNLGNEERRQYEIVLSQNASTRVQRDGETPPAIRIGVYQNDRDHYSAEEWVRSTNFSDFKLSTGT